MQPSKVLLAALPLALLVSCGWNDQRNEDRGRGDAPVGDVIDEPVDVIQFPDRFSNVAYSCDGHGHRVYVTTKSDQSRFLFVVADPTCNEEGAR